MAPSSQPFYSNIPNAPISSVNYPSAPPVGSGGYGDTSARDPYEGMGYSTLPGREKKAAAAPSAPAPAQPAPPAPAPATPAQSGSVTDLYQSPGNPYADRSGRPIETAPTYSAGRTPTRPGARPQVPRGVPPAAPHRGVGSPGRERKRFAPVALLLVFAVIIVGAYVLISEIGKAISSYSDGIEITSPALPPVEDVALMEGDCFMDLNYVRGNLLQPVDCQTPHRFEVSANFAAPWDEYPSEDELASTARDECRAWAVEIEAIYDTGHLDSHGLYPSESSWNHGDREITCFIASVGSSRLVGSAYEGDLTVE